jgi:PPK2 family polyphosphate:nucleotide phosphotransferase
MSFAITVRPGQAVDLAGINPAETGGMTKATAAPIVSQLAEELGELQSLMYAAQQASLLVVLQGMDTSGKDGAIRNVFREVDPQGCRVASFKVPTPAELAHDFLWRIHQQTPERGMFTIFNRSHYEDVLVVRVHDLAPEPVWRARYDQIKAFEQLLTASGARVVKFFLYISKEEQAERLLAREQDVAKAWKLSANDWVEREHWEEYQTAYADAIAACSTNSAPWHIVPANNKWFRDLAIATVLVEELRPLKAGWLKKLEAMGEEERIAIREVKAKQAESQ